MCVSAWEQGREGTGATILPPSNESFEFVANYLYLVVHSCNRLQNVNNPFRKFKAFHILYYSFLISTQVQFLLHTFYTLVLYLTLIGSAGIRGSP